MPCWMNIASEVDLKNPDLKLLADAAHSMGFCMTKQIGYVFAADGRINGKPCSIVVDSNGVVKVGGPVDITVAETNAVKRAYSAQIVKSQAKRFGWQLKETGANRFEVVRR